MGTNYYVDSTIGDNTDDGTTMDNGPGSGTGAWATIKHAVEAGSLVAGDIVWVRRIHVEYSVDPTSHLQPAYSGTPKEPIRVIGWPRTTHSGISSDWTNGSTAVVVDDADMDREKHCGRFITSPNGFDYLITVVTTASGITIDREYAGATQANQAFTIKADEDYALAQAIDDSTWTIKKADWNADADDIPCIDFKDTAYMLYLSAKKYWMWCNLEIRDTTYATGLFLLTNSMGLIAFVGCLFHQDQTAYLGRSDAGGTTVFLRCILDGVGVATMGIYANYCSMIMKDCAMFGVNGYGFYLLSAVIYFENVNLGVEAANTNEFRFYNNSQISGRDVKLGSGIVFITPLPQGRIAFENYGKVLGAHKVFTPQGEITKVAAGAGGDIPNQRTGGAANLIEILYDLTALQEPIAEWASEVFVHEFEVDTSSRSYRYYVQSMAIVTAAQLWITVEYVAEYDDTSEYVFATQTSDEAFTVRADGDDWAEYMEVTGIQPAAASKVRIKCYCSFQHASDKIYIDPKVKII